jgi:hypothetical protein
MRRTRILFFSVLVSLLLLTSCNKKGDPGPTGPAGSFLSGDLIGYCYIGNHYGPPINNSGITVTAEGSGVSASTDSAGRFVLYGLHTGTYTIAFSKSGYGTWKSQGFQFIGGGQTYFGLANIFELPNYNVTHINVSTELIGYIDFKGSISDSTSGPYVNGLLFFGNSPDVSSDPKHYISSYSFNSVSQKLNFQFDMPTYYLSNYGFNRGQTLYVIAYSENAGNPYLDLSTGRYIYPTLGTSPSNVTSFIIP